VSEKDLADRVAMLRDEVLATQRAADREPVDAAVFDTIVRYLAVGVHGQSPAGDQTMHEAISRRLAWGDSERTLLSDLDLVYRRILEAVKRSFQDAEQEIAVIQVATEVACAASRMVAMAALGRAGRERAAHMREELTKGRLRQALARQQEELARLRETAGE
jgi:hypothetical protein